MKPIRSLLLFFCILCLCSGCEKKTAKQEDEEIHHVSAGHLLDKQEEALAKKYDNITLSKNISVTKPEEVSVLECRLREGVCTKENFAMLCENFFDSYQSEKQIEQVSDSDEGKYLKYSHGKEEDGDYGQLGEYGAVTLRRKGYYDYEEILQVFHVDRGEGDDAVYELEGKKISVSEAARFVEEWCEKYWSELEGKQYQYKVKTAYLCQGESGAYSYRFDICKWYQGIPFNDFAMDNSVMGNDYDTMGDSYEVDYFIANMSSAEHLSYFTNQYLGGSNYSGTGAFFLYDLLPHPYEGECLIDIQQALQIFDQKITAGQKMKIDEIGLVYLQSLDGGTIMPAWYFALDEEEYDQEGKRTEKNRHAAVWLRREIFMDARTGSQLVQGSNSEAAGNYFTIE